MKSKILRLICVVVALLLLAGCGSRKKNEAGKASQKTVTCLTSYAGTVGDASWQYDITYEADGVHMKPNPCVNGYENVYGWDGKLLYELRYDEEGVNTYRLDYTYDQNGNLTELLQLDLRDNSTASRNGYVYNAQGQLTSETYEGRAGLMYTITYTYDDRGCLTESLFTAADGEEREKYVYTCDDSGKVLTCDLYYLTNYFGTPGLVYGYTCTYDAEGRLLSNVWTSKSNSSTVNDSQYYTYDDQGRVATFKRVDWDNTTESSLEYTYDAAGRLEKVTDAAEGSSNILHYTEISLTEELAQKAEAWATGGALKAFVVTPEFED